MGVYIAGIFVGSQEFKGKDGSVSYAILIATGVDAYRVFMSSNFDGRLLDGLDMGIAVRVKCRPYVSKDGRVSFSGGSDLRIGE